MRTRTIVVGAGLSGLACGFDLARSGEDVTVLDGADRAGGVVGTQEEHGFLFETGPNTVLAGSASFRGLVDDLGLSDRLVRASPDAKARWLYHKGKLRALPGSPREFLTTDLISWRAKRTILSEPFRRYVPPADGEPEPTFGAFLDERLGREASRRLAGAFVRGVHAAELDELGARSAFPRMWGLAAKHGSMIRGLFARLLEQAQGMPGPDIARSAMVSFPRGLQELVDALAGALGPRLVLNRRALAIERIGARWLVRTSSSAFVADSVVLAAGAPAAARLLEPAGLRADLATLRSISHGRITTVSLGFEAGALSALPAGFGYLVPPGEEAYGFPLPRVLGTIFVSNLFPERAPRGGCCIVSFYRGGDVEALDDAALLAQAQADLALATGAQAVRAPRAVVVRRWSDVIPRYAPGHAERIERLTRELRLAAPGIVLAGSCVAGVSVDQVIGAGREAARAVRARRAEVAA